MLIRRRALLALLILLLTTTNSNAEPGNVQRWLMDTPVSLWQFGISELRELVQEARREGSLTGDINSGERAEAANAYYDWEKNRIVIWANIYKEQNYSKQRCEEYINAMRERGAVYQGTVLQALTQSLYSQEFYRGFSTGEEPKDYLRKMDEIIKLSVRFHDGECEGPLLSEDVFHKTP